MLETTFQERSRILIDQKISERRKILEGEIHKVNNNIIHDRTDGNKSGLDQLYNLMCREFKTRIAIVWRELLKSHKMFGSIKFPSIKEVLKQELYNYVRETYLELNFKIQCISKNTIAVDNKLDEVQAEIIAKFNSEIDVYVDSLVLAFENNKFVIHEQ
jgi:hypothetical protein